MALFFYRLIVGAYGLVIKVAAVANPKARQWLEGRRDWQARLELDMNGLAAGKRVWFHCASYGEFEQGRPLMEELKRREPGTKIILSFFSPSGYLPFRDWEGADIICYLPLDSPANASSFLHLVKPSTIFFIKYEYWLFFLREISARQLNAYLISATFKNHQPFFKWYGALFRQSLQSFRLLFIQDQASADRLQKIGIANFVLSGDTRIDRVLQIRAQASHIEGLKEFKGNSGLLVAGSTWPKDEGLLMDAFLKLKQQNLKMILAPHTIQSTLQEETCRKLKRLGISYSRFSEGINPAAEVLVMDTMGLLARAYRYADFAYVGGGFDEGIHNILEPAVFGVPVCFAGTGHEKFNEAVALLSRGDANLVQTSEDFVQVITRWLSEPSSTETIRKDLQHYFEENSQVTERILDQI